MRTMTRVNKCPLFFYELEKITDYKRRNSMTHLIKVSVFVLLFAYAGVCQAGAFDTCADAETYGSNKAKYFVNVTYNRLACDSAKLQKTEETLENVFKKGILKTTDTDEIKACYYDGMVAGYLEMLLSEYAECDGEPGFEKISVESTGRALEAIFIAAASAIPDYFLAAQGVDRVENMFEYDLSGALELTDVAYQGCFYSVYYQAVEDLELEDGADDGWLNLVVMMADQACYNNYF